MKLTLKRDLPLLLAALLVIWGLWYTRPIGVDTLYPELELSLIHIYLADLKVKSCDIEAWSPRQQKYFEVCSCSNLGDAQARRLRIRYKDENGKMQLCHTLNNTCVAPPRMLIAFLENNLQADGTVKIPEVLWPYMGGTKVLVPTKK